MFVMCLVNEKGAFTINFHPFQQNGGGGHPLVPGSYTPAKCYYFLEKKEVIGSYFVSID